MLHAFAERLRAVSGVRAAVLLDKNRRVLGDAGEWPVDLPLSTVRTLAAATVLHVLSPARGTVADDIRLQPHAIGEGTTLYVALVARRLCVGIICDGPLSHAHEHALSLVLIDLRAHVLDLGSPAIPGGGGGSGGGTPDPAELRVVEAAVTGLRKPRN